MSPQVKRWTRYFVDYSAPAAFAIVYFLGGRDFMKATLAIVVASVVALLVGWIVERRLAPLPLFVGLMGAIFGGLTLVFHAPWIMMVKPTIINFVLGVILFAGLLMKKNPLKMILGDALNLPDEAWRTLMLRFGIFYWVLGVVNLLVWRLTSTETWVKFHSFGLQVLTVLFVLTQLPLLLKYVKPADLPPPPEE